MKRRYCTIVSCSAIFAASIILAAPTAHGTYSNSSTNTSEPVLAANHKTGTSARDMLTGADFAKATPLDNTNWNNDAGYPYRWNGYGFVWNPYPAFSDSNVTGRPTVDVVSGALRSAASLSDRAQRTAEGWTWTTKSPY